MPNKLLLCGNSMENNDHITLPQDPQPYPSIPWKTDMPIRDKILPPTVIAKYSNAAYSTGLPVINVEAFAFLDRDLSLERGNFEYFYNVTMGLKATYELLIYIAFSKPVSKYTPVNNYEITSFKFTFEEGALKGINFGNEKEQVIPLNQVSTVKVFVVNTDPDTSRGTETEVQDDDD